MENGLIITDPKGLITKPKDPFWDASATRRELQNFADIFSENDRELTMRCDTSHIVMNFICERLGLKREDLDAYVQKKLAELKAIRAQQEAAAAKAQSEATDGSDV